MSFSIRGNSSVEQKSGSVCLRALTTLLATILATSPGLARPCAPVGDPPVLAPNAQQAMPVRNSLLPSHDPSLRTDNDVDYAIPDWVNSAPGGVGVTDPGEPSEASVPVLDEERWLDDTGGFVGLHNGMVSYRAVDLVIPGRGIDFELSRRYNSKLANEPIPYAGASPGPMGWGWDHSYNIYLWRHLSESVFSLYNGNGRVDSYDAINQIYKSPTGIYNRIYFDGTYWIIRGRHGSKNAFQIGIDTPNDDFFRLAWTRDANGNQLTFLYENGSLPMRLTAVLDTFGRRIDYGYDATSGRLTSVTDFSGRSVVYTYSSAQTLTTARSPLVTSTGGFNDFPSGRTEKYMYISEPGGVRDHYLETIVRPNDFASNLPSVQFTYYTLPEIIGWAHTLALGGNNGNGVAGGTITYEYQGLNLTSQLGDPTLGRVRTTVTDRKGNRTDFTANENGQTILIEEYLDASQHVSTTMSYNGDGEVLQINHPEGNSETRLYYVPPQDTFASRYLLGYLKQVDYHPDTVRPADQPIRTIQLEWEPVFGHLRTRTDERAKTTEYRYEYMEGDWDTSDPQYNVNSIATELGITASQAAQLVQGFLFDQDMNGDGQNIAVRGNLVQRIAPTVTLSNLGGVQPQWTQEGDQFQIAIKSFTYNQYGQLNSDTDPEENVSIYEYFPATDPCGQFWSLSQSYQKAPGGLIRRIGQDMAFPLTEPQPLGLVSRALSSDIGRDSNTNPPQVKKISDRTYNARGSVVGTVDPRGIATSYSVSELNETWRVDRATSTSAASSRKGGCDPSVAEDFTGQTYSYETKFKYDANGNVITELVENSGNLADQGMVSGYVETYFTYDILNDMRSKSAEHGVVGYNPGGMATWTFDLDSNQNRSAVHKPEGNIDAFVFDPRDLLESETCGSGTPEASTVTYHYDANRNCTEFIDGRQHSVGYAYDGYDRIKSITDQIGSKRTNTYDPCGNPTVVLDEGTYGGPNGAFMPLRRTAMSYDERSRAIQVDWSDPGTPAGPLIDGVLSAGDGKVTNRHDFDRTGRRTYLIQDDAQIYTTRYDGAGRVLKRIDPIGNEVQFCYDDEDNLVLTRQLDKYPNSSTRTFDTYDIYDSLSRRISTTDNLGQTDRYSYDSRGNVVASSDAQGPMTSQYINGKLVNAPGNTKGLAHDGFSRLLLEIQDLRVGGNGAGAIDTSNPNNSDGHVTLAQSWDKNSRLTSQTDDRQKTTSYLYDALDRRTRDTSADASFSAYGFDGNNNRTSVKDARGNQVALGYDNANRLVQINCAPLPGVVGSTQLWDPLESTCRHASLSIL